MNLKQILNGVENLKAKGNLELEINNIASDSRNVTEGTMFIAIKGFDTDGHDYINECIEKGANVIVIDKEYNYKSLVIPNDVTLIVSENTRKTLAISAANFYDNPSNKFKLIGITGSKGKTTTSFMIKSILEEAGQKVGLIGTITNYIGKENIGTTGRTTPESIELQRIFSQMVEKKVDTVVMEVSSQGLKLNRLDGCKFDVVLFTNFSQDHISPKEHLDMEDYFNSKVKLFQMCNKGFINADDYNVIKVADLCPECIIKMYSIDNHSDLIAKDVTVTANSVDFKVKINAKNERIKVSSPGRFSVYNALAAISIANYYEIDAEKIKSALLNIKVPGRSELVSNKKGLNIIIDYAHTPTSFESILKAIKPYARGKLICLFGCGGNRDASKRPLMGEVAGKFADLIILTQDNPRNEQVDNIISDIEKGVKKTKTEYKIIANREEAIKNVIEIAKKDDIILLLGKGHETYMEINGVKNHFDEREIIKKYA